MSRREDYGRRSYKRSRSPDERERSPREDKRRRPYDDDRLREREYSPRATRSSANGTAERRDDRRDRDSRRDGKFHSNAPFITGDSRRYGNRDRERERYEKDRYERRSPEPEKARADRKRISTKAAPPSDEGAITPSKAKPISISDLLEEEEDPPLTQLMGFSKFSSTKGKKHEDYGTYEVRKKRNYRQYMNRIGGFNRPLDSVGA
jgi:U4/U6.U5 tri-snRNP-associated protein 3